jgi:hypothetical protein
MHFRTPILVTIFIISNLSNNNGTLSLDSPILLRLMHNDPPEAGVVGINLLGILRALQSPPLPHVAHFSFRSARNNKGIMETPE